MCLYEKNRYIMRTILLLLFVCICYSCSVHSRPNLGAINDTIYSVNRDYIYGRKIYETYSDERILLCLLCGNKEDTLKILSNLFADDFSLGEPYNQVRDTVLRSKFVKYNDSVNIEQDRMDLFDEEDVGPPYYFTVIIGNDSIIYQSDLHKQNYYGFVEASLHDRRFLFADYQVGKNIKDCYLSNVLSDEIINKISYIELLPCDEYKYPNNCKQKKSNLWYVDMDVSQGRIERLHISSIEN